jgi:hypothetical protein
MNQGPRRISLTKKNGGKKSRDTIPLSNIDLHTSEDENSCTSGSFTYDSRKLLTPPGPLIK